MNAIDAVVFDLGNVLVGWDPFLAFAGRRPRAQVERFFAEVDFPAFNHAQDAGRTWAEARAALAASHPQHCELLDVYVQHFADSVTGELPGAREVVEDVVAAGVRVYGLTNWSAETYHVAGRKAPVVGLLADVLVSGQVGVAKPDPRIYAMAAERFGVVPERTLFTDDGERNVHAATEAGFLGHLFRDVPGLRRHLAGLGVLPASEPS